MIARRASRLVLALGLLCVSATVPRTVGFLSRGGPLPPPCSAASSCRASCPPARASRRGEPGRVSCRAALSDPNFDAWLGDSGVERSALLLGEFEGGIRGVEAARDISAGDVVLSAPLSACLVDRPSSEPMVGIDPEAWRDLAWQCRMSLLLATERARGAASRYSSYISSLPEEPPVPLARWPEEELEELQDPFLQAEADSLLFWGSGLYDDVLMLAPDGERGNIPGREAFEWALDTLQSRTIRLDDGAGEPVRLLVPFLDMLNHKPGCNTRFFLDEGGDRVQLSLGYSVPQGEQVCLNYGDKDNAHLISFYGFALPDNPFDEVLLCPIITDTEWAARVALPAAADEARQEKLEEYCQRLSTSDCFVRRGRVSESVLDAYTLLCADELDLAALHERWERVLQEGVRSVCRDDGVCVRDCDVAAVLARRLQADLAAYPTSLGEDALLLEQESACTGDGSGGGGDQGAKAGRLRCALQLRMGRKKILASAAESLEAVAAGQGAWGSIEEALAEGAKKPSMPG